MACVLLDVDGTLFAPPSTEARFIRYLLRRRRLGPRQAGAAAWFFVRYGVRYRHHVGRKNKAYLTGLSVADVEALARDFVAADLSRELRPLVQARIDEHRRGGDRIVLLTGAADFLVAPLADHLGAAGFVATQCAQRRGQYLARPPLRHPLESEKLLLGEQVCRDLGLALEDCTAYADARWDIPLLERVHRPVAVFPDRVLRNVAERNGWEIIESPVEEIDTWPSYRL